MTDYILGSLILALAMLAIGIMIYSGCMVAIRAAQNEAKRTVNIRAKMLAERMYREKLDNTVIKISQRMVVVEDDLGGEQNEEF